MCADPLWPKWEPNVRNPGVVPRQPGMLDPPSRRYGGTAQREHAHLGVGHDGSCDISADVEVFDLGKVVGRSAAAGSRCRVRSSAVGEAG